MSAGRMNAGMGDDANVGANAGDDVKVRRMILGDIEQVLEIEKASFTLPWTAAAFFNELTNNPFARYLVLELDSRIVGYGGLWAVLDEAHVTNIAVHPDFRGRRLGERILRELMVLAAANGLAKMTLEVRVSNTVARNLYEKFGFKATGVRKGYYSDNGEDALIMWADLPTVPRTPAGTAATAAARTVEANPAATKNAGGTPQSTAAERNDGAANRDDSKDHSTDNRTAERTEQGKGREGEGRGEPDMPHSGH